MSAALQEPGFALYVLKLIEAEAEPPWEDGAVFVIRPASTPGAGFLRVKVIPGGFIPCDNFVFVDKDGTANTAAGFDYIQNPAQCLLIAGISTRAISGGEGLVASPAPDFNLHAITVRVSGRGERGH